MTTTNIPYSPKNHNLNFQNTMNVSSISSIPGVDRSIFPMIQGHRGAPLVEPENTIAAFQHAAHSGANSVELDVFLSKDNELVVFHGGRSAKNPKEVGNLGAHTTSDDNIQNLTLEEMRSLEFVNDTFACPNEKMNGFYIPTLKETLEEVIIKNNMHVTIELKGSTTPKPLVALLDTMKGELDLEKQVTISSFNHDLLRQVKELNPAIHIATLFGRDIDNCAEVAKKFNATEIHLNFKLVTKKIVDELHHDGFIVMAWFNTPGSMTEDQEEAYFLHLLNAGVDTICTNAPDVLASKKNKLIEEHKRVLPKI